MVVWITSDNHFWHKNIIKYCNRPFTTVEEMNETMLSNWNNVVKKRDIVLHLGDFALCCNNEMLQNLIHQLHGQIYLLPGNHDHPTRLSRAGLYVLSAYEKDDIVLYHENIIFSHRPLYDEHIPFNFVNVHGHIHNKKSFGKRINVSVDITNFTPVTLETINNSARKMLYG